MAKKLEPVEVAKAPKGPKAAARPEAKPEKAAEVKV
jgi:hypothetical protein